MKKYLIRILPLAAILLVSSAISSANAQTELIQNGGFESGTGSSVPNWTVSGGAVIVNGVDQNKGFPHSGSQFMNLGGAASGMTSTGGGVSQSISIPNTALTVVKFSFWISYLGRSSLPGTTQDYFVASVAASGGGGTNFYPSLGSGNYQQFTLDLTAYKGKTVTIGLGCSTPDQASGPYNVDDISLQVIPLLPMITTISPSRIESSTNFQTLTITGSNFVSGDTLTFISPEGGTIASVSSRLTVVSSSQLTYKFTNTTDSGIWSVMVNNVDNSLHSGASNFTVSLPPMITSVSPSVLSPANGTQGLNVMGGNFFLGDKLTLIAPDGSHQTNISTSLTGTTNLNANINNTNDSGVWSVIVNTADNTVHSAPANFMVSYLTPSIAGFTAAVAPINGFQPLNFSGENFQPGMTLSFVTPEGVVLTDAATNITIISSTFGTCLFNDGGEPGLWGIAAHSPDKLHTSSTNTFRIHYLNNSFSLITPSRTNLVLSSVLQTNVTFVLEYTLSLTDTNWIPLQTNIGKGLSTKFTNAVAADSGRFYRLRVLP